MLRPLSDHTSRNLVAIENTCATIRKCTTPNILIGKKGEKDLIAEKCYLNEIWPYEIIQSVFGGERAVEFR